MRPFVVLSALSLVGAFFACSAAPIGSLAGSGVDAPDRTSADGDAGTSTTSSGAGTAMLTVTLVGAGSVTSSPAGVTCTGSTCTGTFAVGTAVSLVATPTGGGAFIGWTGACAGTMACAVTLTGASAVTATFGSFDGTWKGTYENKRSANNCNFDNKGTLTLTTTTTDAGTSVALAASMDGMEIRDGDCNLVGSVSGDTSKTNNNTATLAGGALTGTWTVNAGNFGTLDFPFKSTVTGTAMTGAWNCTGCTGQFTLTKQ